MGKLGKGCDFRFNVADLNVLVGSNLSPERATFENVVLLLKLNLDKRHELYELLQAQTEVKVVTEDDIKNKGIIPNGTMAALAARNPQLDWQGLDLSDNVLMLDKFIYGSTNFSDCIIEQTIPGTLRKQRIFIINPNNPKSVSRLHNYLKIKAKLKLEENIDNDILLEAIKIINETDVKALLEKITKATEAGKSDSTIIRYQKKYDFYSRLQGFKINNVKLLLSVYIDNESLFDDIIITKGEFKVNLGLILKNACRTLRNGIENEQFQDIFANKMVEYTSWDSTLNCAKISFNDFFNVIQYKYNSIPKNDDTFDLRSMLARYIQTPSRRPEKIQSILNALIEQTDDEFSYSFRAVDKSYIYLNNVPHTLEERFDDFTYDTILAMSLDIPYRGYNIYVDTNGKYYYSKLLLTTKAYGNRYSSREEVIKRIDQSLHYDLLAKNSLIGFKSLSAGESSVYIPNRFRKGQIIKSLRYEVDKNMPMNDTEQSFIYDISTDHPHTIEAIHEYLKDIVRGDISKQLEQLDDPEKLTCLLIQLNKDYGINRSKLTEAQFMLSLSLIGNEYDYYLIEEVSNPIYNTKTGYRQYYNLSENSVLPIYKTVVTKIKGSEVVNGRAIVDKSGQYPSHIAMMTELGDKINAKFPGIGVKMCTQSDIEELFKDEEQPPEGVKAFVKNGNIYINMSNSSQSDLFHEFTHLMLGVLKAINFDNYIKLIETIANTSQGKELKYRKRKLYPHLADSDLNEEVFADMFGSYLCGTNLDAFLNQLMSITKKKIISSFKSIFGTNEFNTSSYGMTFALIFKSFSFDLNQLMTQTNGLNIPDGTKFRQATNWIAKQKKLYSDSEGKNVGIYEECN